MSEKNHVKDMGFRFGKELDANEFPGQVFGVDEKGAFKKAKIVKAFQDPANYWRIHEKVSASMLLASGLVFFLIFLDQTQIIDKGVSAFVSFLFFVWGLIF